MASTSSSRKKRRQEAEAVKSASESKPVRSNITGNTISNSGNREGTSEVIQTRQGEIIKLNPEQQRQVADLSRASISERLAAREAGLDPVVQQRLALIGTGGKKNTLEAEKQSLERATGVGALAERLRDLGNLPPEFDALLARFRAENPGATEEEAISFAEKSLGQKIGGFFTTSNLKGIAQEQGGELQSGVAPFPFSPASGVPGGLVSRVPGKGLIGKGRPIIDSIKGLKTNNVALGAAAGGVATWIGAGSIFDPNEDDISNMQSAINGIGSSIETTIGRVNESIDPPEAARRSIKELTIASKRIDDYERQIVELGATNFRFRSEQRYIEIQQDIAEARLDIAEGLTEMQKIAVVGQ